MVGAEVVVVALRFFFLNFCRLMRRSLVMHISRWLLGGEVGLVDGEGVGVGGEKVGVGVVKVVVVVAVAGACASAGPWCVS